MPAARKRMPKQEEMKLYRYEATLSTCYRAIAFENEPRAARSMSRNAALRPANVKLTAPMDC
jgi:hypothetical protein